LFVTESQRELDVDKWVERNTHFVFVEKDCVLWLNFRVTGARPARDGVEVQAKERWPGYKMIADSLKILPKADGKGK